MEKKKMNLIFDFDSTFVKGEALDELANIALEGNANKESILSKIKEITTLGMEGMITFPESLSRRFELLPANRNHVASLIDLLKDNISESINRNKSFFVNNRNNIYIISGGFEEYIFPVVADFGILPQNVLSNKFIFDEQEKIIGFDESRLLSREKGKVRQLRDIKLNGDIWMIGDGYTDYEVKKAGIADKFIAFFENVERKNIGEKADQIVRSLDELLILNSRYL